MNVLRIGRYRVLHRLGGGGSSDVYLAEDSMLRRKVALKILRRRDAGESQIRGFEREARCASMLNHPNIVTVFDVGYQDDLQYIATEHVEGETLRERGLPLRRRPHRGAARVVRPLRSTRHAAQDAKGLVAGT